MKRYRTYMNEIKATDTLRQRLRELKTPAKRPVPWKKYGAMAAALVLVLGLGLGGIGYAHYYNTVMNPTGDKVLEMTQTFDPAAHPDIAWEDPAESEPGNKTLGGYEYHEYEGFVCYRILPYIEYGETEEMIHMERPIPDGAVKRNLTQDEIIALLGGEDTVNTHLDWGEYELTGWAAWYEDGSFWGACIDGQLGYCGGPASKFELAVMAGQLPPSGSRGADSRVTQTVRGLRVSADKSDREEHIFNWPTYIHERRVSFMKEDYGYRFELSCGGSEEEAELLVSRLVCRIADEGLGVDLTDAYAEMRGSVCKTCGEEIVPGTRHFHGPIYICPDCGQAMQVDDMRAHIHSFNPNAVDLNDKAPPVSVSGEPYVCTGYPTPDPAESWEISDGHPLAPEGWTSPSDSGAVTDPDLTGSGELCGLPLAPGQHHEDHN